MEMPSIQKWHSTYSSRLIRHSVTDNYDADCIWDLSGSFTSRTKNVAYNFLVDSDGLIYVDGDWNHVNVYARNTSRHRYLSHRYIRLHGAEIHKIMLDCRLLRHSEKRKAENYGPLSNLGDALHDVVKMWPHWLPNLWRASRTRTRVPEDACTCVLRTQ